MAYDAFRVGFNVVGMDVKRCIVGHGPLRKRVAMQGVEPATGGQHCSQRTGENGGANVIVGGHIRILVRIMREGGREGRREKGERGREEEGREERGREEEGRRMEEGRGWGGSREKGENQNGSR